VRCLVMGGNRYIGSSLVTELSCRGHDVTVMNSHPSPLPKGVRRLHGDRRQRGIIREVLKRYRDSFDVVFDNTAYSPDDLAPMLELFLGRVQQFVFTSTVAVYQPNAIQPVHEFSKRHSVDHLGSDPLISYAAGKIRCEDLLLGLHAEAAFPVTCLRISHTLGPRSPLGSREFSVFARLELGRPILIPGEGHPFVHLIHIDDAAQVMAGLIGNGRTCGEVYNVAGTEFASVREHVALMANAVGVEPSIVGVPLEVARSISPPLVHWREAIEGGTVFDISKARRDIDWEPRFDLLTGYQDSYDWYQRSGRQMYSFDFSNDDQLLTRLDKLG
jgi:nucleoside-diphosphate-sugar epimerase